MHRSAREAERAEPWVWSAARRAEGSGLQFVTRRLDDARPLGAAAAFEVVAPSTDRLATIDHASLRT
jgi:hypothetical protein